jgi:hypothetical protein
VRLPGLISRISAGRALGVFEARRCAAVVPLAIKKPSWFAFALYQRNKIKGTSAAGFSKQATGHSALCLASTCAAHTVGLRIER